jgi:hypothetical protein
MVSLRGALELGLLSVYWNLNDDGHKVIKDWLRSQKSTPRFQTIWDNLERHKNFQTFQKKIDIKSRILNLGYLHDYAHSKGYEYSNNFGIFKSNFQTFESKAFEIWFKAFEEVTKVLALLHLIKYPLGVIKLDYDAKFGINIPSFGGLKVFEVAGLATLLEPEEIQALEEIAQQDDHVKEITALISGLPDMTPEEKEQQIVEFDKQMIKSQGLENWLKQEQAMPDVVKNDDKYQKRLAYLIQWAKENNF